MDHFAGLEMSVKETSVCIVDNVGKIVREVKVASEPEALLAVLKKPAYRFKRIGLEAGPSSQWLFSALAEAELPVVCVETRHMQVVLDAHVRKFNHGDGPLWGAHKPCRMSECLRRNSPRNLHAGLRPAF
jgi:transposase